MLYNINTMAINKQSKQAGRGYDCSVPLTLFIITIILTILYL